MGRQHTISKSQIDAASLILDRLRTALAPEFLGLVSTDGHPITVIGPSDPANADSLASLTAGSFAATKQLAGIMNDSEFTLMFHEGSRLNIHIAQVSDEILLVICFHKATQLGKVRLMARRALNALASALEPASAMPEADGRGKDYVSEAEAAIDELFHAGEEDSGSH